MREKLSCEIVQDLLPGYIDGLTSSETNRAVEEHLAECDNCRQMYERMKENETSENPQDEKEIDYLKKVRQKNRFNMMVGVIILLVFFAVYTYWQVFQAGRLMSIDDIEYELEYDATQNGIEVRGNFKDPSRGYGRAVCTKTEDGVNVSFYSTPVTGSHNNEFSWMYFGGEEGFSQLSIDGVIVWENGENINRKTADIYKTKTDYIGDMPACNAVADAIGIRDQFGGYQNELTTDAQPYDWRLMILHPLKMETTDAAREVMYADACVLLAMIKNLDSVTWDYITDEGQETVTITAQDASEYVGSDIKNCGQSASDLQKLLIQTGLMLEENPYIETIPMGEVPYGFEIQLDGESDSAIHGYKWSYYLDGELLNCSQSYVMDKAAASGYDDVIGVDTDFLGQRLTDEELSRLTFDLIVSDWDGNEYTVCEGRKLPAQYGEIYRLVLTGGFEEGFKLIQK